MLINTTKNKKSKKKGGVDRVVHSKAMDYNVVRAKIHKTHITVFRCDLLKHLNQEREVALQAELEQEVD